MEAHLERVEQPPNVCCRDLGNRGEAERLSGDLSFTRCLVCGCRHFELVVDPVDMTAEGTVL